MLLQFQQVYLQYTSEYMKGPMYWHPDKLWLDCNFREPVVALNAEEPWEAEFGRAADSSAALP